MGALLGGEARSVMISAECSPGSNPHSDRPNWRPAENIDEYLQNCRDGLETYSDGRLAKLLGMTRIHLWRCRMVAHIPKELFEHLLEERGRSGISIGTKSLAQVGLAFRRGENSNAETQCCPHCGGVLRVRTLLNKKLQAVVNQWLQNN